MEIPLLGFDIPTWIILLATSLFLIYKYNSRTFNVLKDLGVDGPKPYPFVGTFYQALSMGIGKAFQVNIAKYGKVYADYAASTPNVVVADTDMLKQIMVKDFAYFTNRRKFGGDQKPLDRMLTVLDDDEWKNVRNAMTPAFSGGKLRRTTKYLNDCAQNLVDNLGSVADGDATFDAQNHCGCFATDVIARVAFGVEMDSQKDPDHPFVKYMKEAMDFSLIKKPFLIISLFFPALVPYATKLGFTFLSKESNAYFTGLVTDAIETRKNSNDPDRHDFLQIMMEAKQMKAAKDGETVADDKQRKPLTEDEVLSNCVIFFFAGYSTVGDTMTMTLFALAENPEMQDKLLEEINSVFGDSEGCSYDQLKQLGYLDMVVDEALRIYTPAMMVDRICSQDVVIKGYTFLKDFLVTIPIYAIHMDPDIWPEPEKFIPERFSPEKKAKMNPYHYMPFGYGPRNCIAMRMALIEIKIALVHIIRKFRILKSHPDQVLERNKMTGSPGALELKVESR